MVRIACAIPNPLDCTSLYRASGPFQTLRRENQNIHLETNQEMNWANLKAADLAFFQRPCMEGALNLMRMCQANRKPIWLDYDDNLHAIPLCNRRFPIFGNPQTQHAIATMIAMADAVTVTTNHLRDALAQLLKCFPPSPEYRLGPEKILVIPNAYDYELLPALSETRPERTKLVAWRGSDSHCKDLMLVTSELGEAMKNNPEWKLEMMGEPFWWTIEHLKKVMKPNALEITAAQDPINFFKYLARQRPALVIVPLEDQGFNRSKSNIAWIEATAAGAVVLAPAWEEWSKPGVITYEGDFGAKLEAFLRGDFDSDRLWKESRDYIVDNLQLGQTNKLRLDVIERLVSAQKKN